MSETRFMQTVLFGGYERSAVEERFESLNAQLFTLKNELRETKLLLAELKKGSDEAAALEEILAGERVKMAQVQAQNETVTKKIRAAEDDIAARDQEIEQLKAQIESLQAELSQKNEKLTYLEANSDGEALSAVFIEAQKSADLLVSMAKKDAAALDTNSKRLAENLVAEANNTAKKLIYDAETRSAELLTDSESRSEQLSAATENIKAYVLDDVTRLKQHVTAIREAFETLQEGGLASLTQAEALLGRADADLKAGGVPVYREILQPKKNAPREPEYAPVDHTYYTEADKAAAEAKIQREEELKRLRAMANSINGEEEEPKPGAVMRAKAEETKKPKKSLAAAIPEQYAEPAEAQQAPPAKASAPVKDVGKIVPDLAALAAQADALSQQGKKKVKYTGTGRKPS
ncbi:MAG: hypothetical protein J5722_00480 [Oscillospiraceae bacterium]|nr:hypothetical protein [Oscillospiraceae bacterium]